MGDLESPAPWSAIAIINEEERRNDFSLEIPYMGSLLAYNNLEGNYQGMIELDAEFQQLYGRQHIYTRDARVLPFRIYHVGIGMLLMLAAFGGLFLWWRRREAWTRRAGTCARSSGCSVALVGQLLWLDHPEMGRQPWIVRPAQGRGRRQPQHRRRGTCRPDQALDLLPHAHQARHLPTPVTFARYPRHARGASLRRPPLLRRLGASKAPSGGTDAVDLVSLWFWLIAPVLFCLYFFLEGFDFPGVDILRRSWPRPRPRSARSRAPSGRSGTAARCG